MQERRQTESNELKKDKLHVDLCEGSLVFKFLICFALKYFQQRDNKH